MSVQHPIFKNRNCEDFLHPFHAATRDSLLESHVLGNFDSASETYALHRFSLRGENDPYNTIRLGIFATIHGDEPQGAKSMLELVRLSHTNPELFHGYELHFYPLCNPTGYVDGTRHARCGKDLNRLFWRDSQEPEIKLLENEILTHRFDGIVALHSDDTSDGLYGFVRGATLSHELLTPALAAASQFLPINHDPVIDGFRANAGVIVEGYEGILSAGHIEPRPFEIVFETPALTEESLQIQAALVALADMLRRYREMMATGNDI